MSPAEKQEQLEFERALAKLMELLEGRVDVRSPNRFEERAGIRFDRAAARGTAPRVLVAGEAPLRMDARTDRETIDTEPFAWFRRGMRKLKGKSRKTEQHTSV